MDGVVSSWKGTLVAIAVIAACFVGIHFAQDTESKANLDAEEQRKTEIITAIKGGNDEIIERLDRLIEVMEANNATR